MARRLLVRDFMPSPRPRSPLRVSLIIAQRNALIFVRTNGKIHVTMGGIAVNATKLLTLWVRGKYFVIEYEDGYTTGLLTSEQAWNAFEKDLGLVHDDTAREKA
jgi:hypothetical protein